MRLSPLSLVQAIVFPSVVCFAATAQTVPQRTTEYGKLPLSFEANQGQANSEVKFVSRGNGYSLALTDSAAILSLSKHDPSTIKSLTKGGLRPRSAEKKAREDIVRMELSGATHSLPVTAEDKLAGVTNYFIGNDPSQWKTNVPTYSRVKYQGVYPGVDLVYYGNQRQFGSMTSLSPPTPTPRKSNSTSTEQKS